MSHIFNQDNLFYNETSIFENKITTADIQYKFAMTEFMEAVEETKSDSKIQNAIDTVKSKVSKFFADIITALSNFVHSIVSEIDVYVRERKIREKLKEARQKINESKELGEKTVEFVDISNLKSTFRKINSELLKYSKKFNKMDYKGTDDLSEDLEAFNKSCERYEAELDEALNKKVSMKLSSALDFIESELDESDVMREYNKVVTFLNEVKHIASTIEIRKDLMGKEAIPKKIGFLKSIAIKISTFFQNIVKKIKKATATAIATVVFVIV